MEIDEISKIVSTTLSYLSEAQKLSAINIANANVPGKNAMSVSFEDFINEIDGGKELTHHDVTEIMHSLVNDNKKIDLGAEVAQSHELALKYDTMVELFNKQLALYRMAITGRG